MIFLESLLVSFDVLKKQKARTLLTMFGFAFGVALIIIILSVGSCAGDIMKLYYSGIEEGKYIQAVFMSETAGNNVRPDSLTMDDINSFNSGELPDYVYGISIESPETVEGSVPLLEYSEAEVNIKGVSSASRYIEQLKIENGRFISDEDCSHISNVTVIPDTLAVKLFGSAENALMNDITVKLDRGRQVDCTVIGVYMAVNLNEKDKYIYSVYFPYTLLNEICGYSMPEKFPSVRIAYKQGTISENSAIQYVYNSFLSESMGVKKYCLVSTSYTDSEDSQKTVAMITLVFIVILGIVFLVSGLGLTNTLLVSISERTQEIGILKAIGARDKDIRVQFITEACTICLGGCLSGIILGTFVLPVKILLLAFLFSMITGVVFGIIPAIKASRKNVVDALRTF